MACRIWTRVASSVALRVGQFGAVEVAFERAAVVALADAQAQQAVRAVRGKFRGAGEQCRQGVARGDELLRAAQVLGLDGVPYGLDEHAVRLALGDQHGPVRQRPGQRLPRAGVGAVPHALDEPGDPRRLADHRLRAARPAAQQVQDVAPHLVGHPEAQAGPALTTQRAAGLAPAHLTRAPDELDDGRHGEADGLGGGARPHGDRRQPERGLVAEIVDGGRSLRPDRLRHHRGERGVGGARGALGTHWAALA
jgi:hypothetical protein